MRAESAILDGEIVCLDANACSQFKELRIECASVSLLSDAWHKPVALHSRLEARGASQNGESQVRGSLGQERRKGMPEIG